MPLPSLFALLACAPAPDSAPLSAPPQLFLVSPEDGEVGQAGAELTVSVIVSDDVDDVNELEVQLTSDLAGPLDHALPDKLGRVDLHATLGEGDHLLTVTVTDTQGQTASTGVDYVVRGTALFPPDVDLTPDAPVTGDALTAVLLRDATSNDGSPFDYHYEWTRDGEPTDYDTAEVPEGIIHAGERWAVRVSAYADEVQSVGDVALVDVGNAPPEGGGGKVVASDDGTQVTCAVDPPTDREGDALRTTFHWTLGDAEWPDDLEVRPMPVAPRGTLVGCVAWVDDGTSLVRVATQPLALPNHPPSVPSVSVTPTEVTTGATLGCALPGGAADVDGDPLTSTFTWTVDGVEGVAAGPTFRGDLHRGDTVACGVTVDDGAGGSTTLSSPEVTVGNAAPVAPVVRVEPTDAVVGDLLSCVVTQPASDPDGDTLRCAVTWEMPLPVADGETFPTDRLPAGQTLDCVMRCTDDDATVASVPASITLRPPISGDGEAADAMVLLASDTANARFGTALAALPDLDGDGRAELGVGAPGVGAGGAVYVFPASGLRGASELGTADAAGSWVADGAADDVGSALAAAGDTDGDGLGDVVVGAPWNDAAGADAGLVYVIPGGVALGPDVALGDAAAWTVTGEPGDWFGARVTGGDLDGDGLAEVIVAGPASSLGGAHAGAVAVYRGDSVRRSGGLDLSDSDALVVGAAAGDQLGWAVAACADADGDGYAELALGSPRASVDGRADAGSVALAGGGGLGGYAGVDEVAWLRLTGEAAGDRLGTALACPGDLDADGLGDLAVGAPRADRAAADTGFVAVLFGQSGGDLTLGASEADALFFGDAASAQLGAVVAAGGDLDHDGVTDLLVGAPGAASGTGAVDLLRAASAGDWGPDGSAFDATIAGNAATDRIGDALAGGLDLEGDGFGEVALGAPHASASASEGGAVYVFTGRSSM